MKDNYPINDNPSREGGIHSTRIIFQDIAMDQPSLTASQPHSPQPTAHSPQPAAHSPQPTAHSPQPAALGAPPVIERAAHGAPGAH